MQVLPLVEIVYELVIDVEHLFAQGEKQPLGAVDNGAAPRLARQLGLVDEVEPTHVLVFGRLVIRTNGRLRLGVYFAHHLVHASFVVHVLRVGHKQAAILLRRDVARVEAESRRGKLLANLVKLQRRPAGKVEPTLVAHVIVQRLKEIHLLRVGHVKFARPQFTVVLRYAWKVYAAKVDERQVGETGGLYAERVIRNGLRGDQRRLRVHLAHGQNVRVGEDAVARVMVMMMMVVVVVLLTQSRRSRHYARQR